MGQGRQAYVVCPLVEESATLDARSATQTHEELRDGPFRNFRVGLLHGQQDDQTKAAVMECFRKRELDLLVCTTVIEVGVDVPNATLMVIEHAERFGLSQLHQLRGPVSRGPVAGQCYLFAEPSGDDGRLRLRAFLRTRDGFALAEEDMRLRGVGEFFGTRQHGIGELRLANLVTDGDLLSLARKDAFALVAEDSRLRRPGTPCCVPRYWNATERRWTWRRLDKSWGASGVGCAELARPTSGCGGPRKLGTPYDAFANFFLGSTERRSPHSFMELHQQAMQFVEVVFREFADQVVGAPMRAVWSPGKPRRPPASAPRRSSPSSCALMRQAMSGCSRVSRERMMCDIWAGNTPELRRMSPTMSVSR